MKIRPTTMEELDQLMEIYQKGKQFMREQGNLSQWTNGYPNREVIAGDIKSGKSYVCIEDGRILGAFYFAKEEDPTYGIIDQGDWLNHEPYGVIHRVVVGERKRGVASHCLSWCFQQHGNLKIDTHPDNEAMQKALIKAGFAYCGIIYLEDGEERIAFQKSK